MERESRSTVSSSSTSCEGHGESVVLIHWGLCASWAQPLMAEPALADRFPVLRYHRAGFAGSDGVRGPIGMAEHAAHCAGLMRGSGSSGRTSSAIPRAR